MTDTDGIPYELIGRVATSYNRLDANLIKLACRLLDTNQLAARAFARRLNIRQSNEFIRAWTREVKAFNAGPKPEWFCALDSVCTKTGQLDEQRNTILHSIYIISPFDGEVLAARARAYGTDVGVLVSRVNPDDLEEFVVQCQGLAEEIQNLVKSIPPEFDPMASTLT